MYSPEFIRNGMASEPARRDPKTLAPFPAWIDALEFFVDAGMGEIEGIRNGCHGLETNEAVPQWRIHHGGGELRPVVHRDLLPLCLDGEFRLAAGAADQAREEVVKVGARQLQGVGQIH